MKALFTSPEFTLFGIHVPKLYFISYPIFFAIAFIVSLFIALHEGKKRGLERKRIITLWALCIAGGLTIGRMWYMLIWARHSFLGYLKALIDPAQGGLASSGAFLGVFLTAILYARFSKRNLWPYADLFGIAGGITVAIGRFACLFAGCCYGAIADLPWSVYYLDALRHPTQLYEIIAGLFIFIYMQGIKSKKRFHGNLFLLFISLYSSIRFFIEFAREEPRIWIFTYSQYIYAVFFAVAFSLVILANRPRKGFVVKMLGFLGLCPLDNKEIRKKTKGKK